MDWIMKEFKENENVPCDKADSVLDTFHDLDDSFLDVSNMYEEIRGVCRVYIRIKPKIVGDSNVSTVELAEDRTQLSFKN
jgi:hypothetical protein